MSIIVEQAPANRTHAAVERIHMYNVALPSTDEKSVQSGENILNFRAG